MSNMKLISVLMLVTSLVLTIAVVKSEDTIDSVPDDDVENVPDESSSLLGERDIPTESGLRNTWTPPVAPLRSEAEEELYVNWFKLVELLRDSQFAITGSSVEPRFFNESGRGIMAVEQINPMDVVFDIPQELCITEARVLQHHPTWAPLAKEVQAPSIVGLFVARVRARVEKYKALTRAVFHRSEYANLKFLDDCAGGLQADADVLALLPPWGRRYVRELQKIYEEDWAVLQERGESAREPFGVTQAQFLEGVCHRLSRSFYIPENDSALVPLLDWMNHDVDYNIGYSYGDRNGKPHFIAFAMNRRILPGEQLTIRYSAGAPIHMFTMYGFVDNKVYEDVESDEVYDEVPLRLPPIHPGDPNADAKRELMRRYPSDYIRFGRSHRGTGWGFDGLALELARKLLLTPEEPLARNFTHLHRGLIVSRPIDLDDITDGGDEVLSDANEAYLEHHLYQQCSQALAKIPPADDIDYPSDSKVKAGLMKAAVDLSRTQREALQRCMELFKAH